MRAITIHGSGQAFVDSLKDEGEVFTLDITNSTTTVYVGGITYKYTTGKKLKPKELAFIKQVLAHCEANIPSVTSQRGNIKYIRHGKIKQNANYTKDIYEVDLNQAYWNYAYTQGYITKELYYRGLKVSKQARLMALGNLAKKISQLLFNGKRYEKINTIYSTKTEGIFFDVAMLTDVSMQKLVALAGDDYLFYWVDAIFIQGKETLSKIEWFLKEYKLAYKIKKMHSIRKYKDKVIVKDDRYSRPDGTDVQKKGYREFNFHKGNILKLKHDETERTEIQIRDYVDTSTIPHSVFKEGEAESI